MINKYKIDATFNKRFTILSENWFITKLQQKKFKKGQVEIYQITTKLPLLKFLVKYLQISMEMQRKSVNMFKF